MFVVSFALLALQPLPAAQSRRQGRDRAEPDLQHDRLVHLEHEPAALLGRSDDELSSQLFALMWLQFVSAAHRHRGAGRARARAGRPQGHGQLLRRLQRASFLVLLPARAPRGDAPGSRRLPMTLAGAAAARTLEGAAADHRTRARSRPSSRSSSSARTAAASSARTPPIPFENPTFWTNVLAMICDHPHPDGERLDVRPDRGPDAPRGRRVRRHAVCLLLAQDRGRRSSSRARRRAPSRSCRRSSRWRATLEGKEMRFGAPYGSGPLWAVLTTSTSNGSVGAMHDSLNPLTGLMPMVGMWLNATFGGVGVGMINMFIYIVIAVFIAGMMVGRTPEYLNRRVEAREMKLAILTVVRARVLHPGRHRPLRRDAVGAGDAQQLGSARLQRDPLRVQLRQRQQRLGLRGTRRQHRALERRHGSRHAAEPLHPDHPAAGHRRLARRASAPPRSRRARSASRTSRSASMLLATILIIGALTFFPAAALGPIAEHLFFLS